MRGSYYTRCKRHEAGAELIKRCGSGYFPLAANARGVIADITGSYHRLEQVYHRVTWFYHHLERVYHRINWFFHRLERVYHRLATIQPGLNAITQVAKAIKPA